MNFPEKVCSSGIMCFWLILTLKITHPTHTYSYHTLDSIKPRYQCNRWKSEAAYWARGYGFLVWGWGGGGVERVGMASCKPTIINLKCKSDVMPMELQYFILVSFDPITSQFKQFSKWQQRKYPKHWARWLRTTDWRICSSNYKFDTEYKINIYL